MLERQLLPKFDCSFCNYLNIQEPVTKTETIIIVGQQGQRKCEFCAHNAQQRAGVQTSHSGGGANLREALSKSCRLITAAAADSFKAEESKHRQLQLIIARIKRVALRLRHIREDRTIRAVRKGSPQDEGGKLQCDLCSYSTYRKELLRRHKRTHEGGRRNLKCPSCRFTALNHYYLRKHLMTHTGEVPYQCSECSFSTAYSSSLKVHERGHTGERPYGCKYCTQRFACSSHLLTHERRHLGRRLYKCGHCNSKYVTSNDLVNHVRRRHLQP